MSPEELRQHVTQVGSTKQSLNDGECISCPSHDKPAKYAVERFWKNDLYHAFRYVYIHSYIHTYIHIFIHVCTYVCMNVCMYVCMYVYTYMPFIRTQ